MNGSANPKMTLTRASRLSLATTSVVVVGSKVGIFVQTLNGPAFRGHLQMKNTTTNAAIENKEAKYATPADAK